MRAVRFSLSVMPWTWSHHAKPLPTSAPTAPPARPIVSASVTRSRSASIRVSPIDRMTPISLVRSMTDIVIVLKIASEVMNTTRKPRKPFIARVSGRKLFIGSRLNHELTTFPSISGRASTRASIAPSAF